MRRSCAHLVLTQDTDASPRRTRNLFSRPRRGDPSLSGQRANSRFLTCLFLFWLVALPGQLVARGWDGCWQEQAPVEGKEGGQEEDVRLPLQHFHCNVPNDVISNRTPGPSGCRRSCFIDFCSALRDSARQLAGISGMNLKISRAMHEHARLAF